MPLSVPHMNLGVFTTSDLVRKELCFLSLAQEDTKQDWSNLCAEKATDTQVQD